MRRALLLVASSAWLAAACAAQAAGKAVPPRWDAGGIGPLPRQGIACVDMSADGRFVAVGTIAAPGDPSVFLLDANGGIAAQHEAGLRWIDQVAVGNAGQFIAAVCSTPTGSADDRPAAFTFAAKATVAVKTTLASPRHDPWFFHYGDHSNHLATPLRAAGGQPVAVVDDRVVWFAAPSGAARRQVRFARQTASVVTAFAVGADGKVVLGCSAGRADGKGAPGNLFVIEPDGKAPAWSRPICTDAEAAPTMEEARHGPPAPVIAARKIWAPLAVALDTKRGRIAAADYQGWARRGVRFMPSRPTVHVYDRQGKLIRRFGAESFAKPFWCELAFSSDGASVLAWPHNWPCRGLAGQAILPADENVRKLYVLDLATGRARAIDLPAAISSVAHSAAGATAVACWNGRVYLLDSSFKFAPARAGGLRTGAACLVRVSRDGRRVLAAGTNGVVRMLDGAGRELWRRDLNQTARQGPKPWTRNQKAERVAPGIWRTNGNLAHSDMGSQVLVEAPGGLILIEANSGHSFEQNWARIRGAGLDPMKVRHVLLTHEHGDHAPGAYLWRVVTGGRVVASRETAYVLQHCLPDHTGYGFHPPNPVDIVVRKDRELKLAGLAVRAIRVPSHTWGSTAYVFRKEGKTYAATGDLIMPGGVLGYDGSIDFSGKDVLASLRKLQRMDLDVVLGGHGGGSADEFLAKGIGVGEATGWGRTKPEKPDPLHGFASKDYLVTAWLEKTLSAAFGDVNGDGRPDVAVLVDAAAGEEGLAVKVYLNKGGAFGAADAVLDLPDWLRTGDSRLLVGCVNKDNVADLFVCGQSREGHRGVLLMSLAGKMEYRPIEIRGSVRTSRILPADLNGDGLTDLVLLNRFAADQIAYQSQTGTFRTVRAEWRNGMDLRLVDVNGDGRADLVTSGGDVLLRQPNGSLSPPLPLGAPKEWAWVAAGDFDRDGQTELALLTQAKSQDGGAEAWLFENTGSADRPFAPRPTRRFGIPGAAVLRCGPTVADWNGDGVADLILTVSGRRGAMVLPGRPGHGLDPRRAVRIAFDYQVHHDTPTGVADFDGDGKADLAAFGHSHRTVPGVFIRLQTHKQRRVR